MTPDLKLGDYRQVLRDVECDLVCTDTPYSQRTHDGHDAGAARANRFAKAWPRANASPDPPRSRRELSYDHWTAADVFEFVQFWAPRCRGWMVCLSDSDFCQTWRAAFEWQGFCGFHPLPILIPGMTVRMTGDGPSSWCVYANVARPRRAPFSKWMKETGYNGRGFYGPFPVGQIERAGSAVAGAKPLDAMRALIRDFSRPGDVAVDPCAGGATTLIAAAMEGRRAVGAEVDEETFRAAQARLARGWTPVLPGMEVVA